MYKNRKNIMLKWYQQRKHHVLAIDFRDKDDKIHTLKYWLYHSALSDKYIQVLRRNKVNANNNINYYFNNKTEADYSDLCEEIKECVRNVNKHYKGNPLPEYDTPKQKELNHLHDLFEQWGAEPNSQDDTILATHFFRLNELIHMCEDVQRSTSIMGCVVDVRPPISSTKEGLHFAITDKDRLMTTSQYKWGALYLGYNTLGKDYLSAMHDNDVRLIERDEVKPQERYAAEVWVNFGSDMEEPFTFPFASWIDKLEDKTRQKLPLHNIQKMTLGRLALGEIMQLDDTFAKIDSNPKHWKNHNHYCKQRWNQEVFTTFREVVDIREDSKWPPEEIIDFINKDKQWWPDINAPIDFDLWNSDWPWAPMDVELDYNKVHNELETLDPYFISHRDLDNSGGYGHAGWSGLTLHGIASDKTEAHDQYGFKTEEEANYHWTDICDKAPYIVDMIKSLPYSKFSRVRIMRLAPGGYIMPHNDGEGRFFGPYNLALTHPDGCVFNFEGKGQVPFKPGRGFFLDLGVRHCVLNYSREFRYHIIIHGIPTEGIAPRIKAALGKI